jgi:hypothetical protein
MPTLPDIEVTDGQRDRLFAAMPGDTGEEKADWYRQYVRQMLRQQVIDQDVREATDVAREDVERARELANNHPDNL